MILEELSAHIMTVIRLIGIILLYVHKCTATAEESECKFTISQRQTIVLLYLSHMNFKS